MIFNITPNYRYFAFTVKRNVFILYVYNFIFIICYII